MPKRIRKMPQDVNQMAYRTVQISTQEPVEISRSLVSRVMSEMGRKGGKIGGKRKLVTLTAERRKAIARKAANARWHRDED